MDPLVHGACLLSGLVVHRTVQENGLRVARRDSRRPVRTIRRKGAEHCSYSTWGCLTSSTNNADSFNTRWINSSMCYQCW